jgi:hypothetical protein
MTLRPRSVVLLTDGSFLDTSADGVKPAMDWLVAQIKYYSGLDAFPFVVDKGIDLNEALKDFTTAYGTVLYLDNNKITEIPHDLLLVRHQEIVKLAKT